MQVYGKVSRVTTQRTRVRRSPDSAAAAIAHLPHAQLLAPQGPRGLLPRDAPSPAHLLVCTLEALPPRLFYCICVRLACFFASRLICGPAPPARLSPSSREPSVEDGVQDTGLVAGGQGKSCGRKPVCHRCAQAHPHSHQPHPPTVLPLTPPPRCLPCSPPPLPATAQPGFLWGCQHHRQGRPSPLYL